MSSSWDETVQRYTGYVFLWQDLDGVHLANLPATMPHTSIMWGSQGDRLVRLRMAEDEVRAAEVTVRVDALMRNATAAWPSGWGPAAQFRPADAGLEVTRQFEEFVHRSPTGAPVTFVRAVGITGDKS